VSVCVKIRLLSVYLFFKGRADVFFVWIMTCMTCRGRVIIEKKLKSESSLTVDELVMQRKLSRDVGYI
jgi:hypothetical protein